MTTFTKRLLVSSLYLAITATVPVANASNPSDIQKTARFLLNHASFQGDGNFMTINGTLPRSYYSTADYWGGYVCGVFAPAHQQSCDVTDYPRMEGTNFVLNGGDTSGSALQVERTDAKYGTDIYDAATWQIALSLSAKHKLLNKTDALQAIDNENQRLQRDDTRASGSQFQYGYQYTVSSAKEAYSYRMLGDAYLEQDPLTNSKYASYIHFSGTKTDEAKLFAKISWPDWKPITGENAWAYFIGPLQADAIQADYIPYKNASIQNALQLLPTIQKMQAEIGGIYYAPGGSDGNEGPITPGEISTENSLSTYAGLKILSAVLIKTDQLDANADHAAIKSTLATIQTMTGQLESFFKNYAWDKQKQEFIAGGTYFNQTWKANTGLHAVDVNTWGIAALTPKVIDEWFGDGSAFAAWQQVRTWGSYCDNASCSATAPIQGVGFSDQDQHAVLSGEWTFGAITAVNELQKYYKTNSVLSKSQFTSLNQDDDAMRKSVLRLRNDHYLKGELSDSIDAAYQVTLPSNEFAYLYANKRYHIPFGWYANPIPSTASTSWAIMVYYHFNPFVLGG